MREKKKMEKRKNSSHPQNRPISKAGVKTNVAIKAQKSQPPVARAEYVGAVREPPVQLR